MTPIVVSSLAPPPIASTGQMEDPELEDSGSGSASFSTVSTGPGDLPTAPSSQGPVTPERDQDATSTIVFTHSTLSSTAGRATLPEFPKLLLKEFDRFFHVHSPSASDLAMATGLYSELITLASSTPVLGDRQTWELLLQMFDLFARTDPGVVPSSIFMQHLHRLLNTARLRALNSHLDVPGSAGPLIQVLTTASGSLDSALTIVQAFLLDCPRALDPIFIGAALTISLSSAVPKLDEPFHPVDTVLRLFELARRQHQDDPVLVEILTRLLDVYTARLHLIRVSTWNANATEPLEILEERNRALTALVSVKRHLLAHPLPHPDRVRVVDSYLAKLLRAIFNIGPMELREHRSTIYRVSSAQSPCLRCIEADTPLGISSFSRTLTTTPTSWRSGKSSA